MSGLSDSLARLIADPEAPARRYSERGDRVVGILGPGAPVDLIVASGALPVRLCGDPCSSTTLADEWMEPIQDGSVRSIFDRLLAGRYDMFEMIVVPRSSEQNLQFYHLVEHVRSERPDLRLPPLHLFNLLQTPTDRSTRFVRAELDRLANGLMGQGRTLSDDDLREAIGARNAVRAAFRHASEARRGAQGASGSDMLHLAIAGQIVERQEFERMIADAEGLPKVEGPRVLLSGHGEECKRVTRAIEALGARVVAEDHDWGEALYAADVPATDDPLDGLSIHCQFHAPTVRLPVETIEARFDAHIRDVQPQAVVFALEANDDTLGWDLPRRVTSLNALEVPSLVLIGTDYFSAEVDNEKLGAFLDKLREAPR